MSDDDIENDFDTDDFDDGGFDDGGFDDLNSQKGSLGDLWRNNPVVKIGTIILAVAFLIGGIIIFGGEVDTLPESQMAPARDVTEVPGSAEVSETIREATEEETVRRTEEAVRTQGSAMPTPIDPPKGVIGLQFDEPEEEDPLERWRRMQQERIAQQQLQAPKVDPQIPQPPPVDTRTPAIQAMSQAMSQQMASVLDAQDFQAPKVTDVSAPDYIEILEKKEREELDLLAKANSGNTLPARTGDSENLNIIVPAGTIEYAQMITEANTDAPGPILAQIVSGPLRGGRMIGTFESTGKYLTLSFKTVVLDGIDFKAEGIAIDPATTLPGVVTDINQRYFTRVLLPAAAEFVEGFTEAIAESGTTTITISGDSTSTTTTQNPDSSNDQEVASGVAQAGEEISEILEDIADDTKPLLRVRAGTPIGILFVKPVTGTPQVLEDREDEAFEREKALQSLSGFNFTQ